MKFYDFQGSEYDAVIWAKDIDDALRKYKEDICDEGLIECHVIDIDGLQKYMVENFKKCTSIEDDDNEMSNGAIKEVLYNIITSDATQVILLDTSLS